MAALESICFWAAALGYVVAFGHYATYAFTKRERLSDAGLRLLGASVVLHLASLLLRTAVGRSLPDHAGYVPWSNWYESFSLFAFSIAAVFLLIKARARLPILGVFVLPWNMLTLFASLLHPTLSGRAPLGFSWEILSKAMGLAREIPRVPEALRSPWMVVHVPLIFLSYAGFAAAFGVGWAYLIQERQIKSKHPTEISYRLPSLEELDRLMRAILLGAFPALTVGILLGGRWAHLAWEGKWILDPKVLAALIVWGVYGAAIALRRWADWRGRRAAYMCLAGFSAILITYVGVNYLSKVHGFLTGGAG